MSYTVQTLENCKVVFGALPVEDFVAVTRLAGANAVLATDIASRIGATAVFGAPEDLDRLRALPLPLSAARQSDIALAKDHGLPPAVVDWLSDGDRGASSDAVCKRLFGVPKRADTDHPHDPDDLSRCRAKHPMNLEGK